MTVANRSPMLSSRRRSCSSINHCENGARSLRSLSRTMIDEYDVTPDVLRDDVLRLVGELRERGIVTPRESVQG